MTKFANPTFNSPANNENYNDNYNSTFGAKCTNIPCLNSPVKGYDICQRHMDLQAVAEPNPVRDKND